jgi:integrase
MINDLLPPALLKNAPQELPEEVTTRSGTKFDPRLDRWTYRDNTKTINLDFADLDIAVELLISAKRVLIWYAENMSPDHLTNMFVRLKHFLKSGQANTSNLSMITSNHLINYRVSLSKNNSWYLGNLSGFLKKWHALNIPGVTDDAISFLKQLRLEGNLKGEAVSTMDVLDGPFSDIELGAIHDSIGRAFEDGVIGLGDYILVLLFMALGPRPIQYASLKVCDVGMSQTKDGTALYTLNIPRAKQREKLSRSAFNQRVLIPQIGEKLVEHVTRVRAQFSGILPDLNSAPVFPAKRSHKNEPQGFEYHQTAHTLGVRLRDILNKLNIVSERTGETLHITATRFRRTLGTRAAMEGHGELVIAELLDHSDTQNVGVYVQATPEIVERIDRAMALHLAPLAQAFAGVIIKNESEALRRDDPASRICDPRFEPTMKPMGNCGQHGFCGQLAPISCYTFRTFQPWLDGPHEAVLNHLVSERERLMMATDARIASINDRTILAVAEVVRRCEEIRSEMSEAENG